MDRVLSQMPPSAVELREQMGFTAPKDTGPDSIEFLSEFEALHKVVLADRLHSATDARPAIVRHAARRHVGDAAQNPDRHSRDKELGAGGQGNDAAA
eukprot:3594797-Rhodomonas_salina.1